MYGNCTVTLSHGAIALKYSIWSPLLAHAHGTAFMKVWAVPRHPHNDRGSNGACLGTPPFRGLGGSEPGICNTNQCFKKEQERTITRFLAWDTET